MSAQLELARRLYDGFLAHDAPAILGLLKPDFEGNVSAGMPLGVGGRYDSAEAMMRDVWIPIFGAYDVRVEADELLECGERVVAVGGYRGAAREGGEPFDASFAHVLTIDGGLIAALRQITDTASWPAVAGG
ncbi:MAG TPA: nuclear transport factor 2 family protein [Solirubrobacterales bacterium]|jgi:ketosteroid isomerase-like protein|nr:nuclear transport factor 2 family protein [Solirubrobacterales bacterium]